MQQQHHEWCLCRQADKKFSEIRAGELGQNATPHAAPKKDALSWSQPTSQASSIVTLSSAVGSIQTQTDPLPQCLGGPYPAAHVVRVPNGAHPAPAAVAEFNTLDTYQRHTGTKGLPYGFLHHNIVARSRSGRNAAVRRGKDEKADILITKPFFALRRTGVAFVGAKALTAPLALAWLFRYFPPAVAQVYIVSFRTDDDRRPSKFIVLAENMRAAIDMAWEHSGADFQSRFDKSTAQAVEMRKGVLRVL